jgi:hypothetical protein
MPRSSRGERQRWRIENGGFGVQKHGRYAMEHAYAKEPMAVEDSSFLLQLAHLFVQPLECRFGGKNDIRACLVSLRNLAADLLESLRTAPLPTPAKLDALLARAIEAHLDTT